MTDTQKIHQFAVQNKLAERYLLDELEGADKEDFEQHFWQCASCFEQVKAGQELKDHIAAGAADALHPRLHAMAGKWEWLKVPVSFLAALLLLLVILWRIFFGGQR